MERNLQEREIKWHQVTFNIARYVTMGGGYCGPSVSPPPSPSSLLSPLEIAVTLSSSIHNNTKLQPQQIQTGSSCQSSRNIKKGLTLQCLSPFAVFYFLFLRFISAFLEILMNIHAVFRPNSTQPKIVRHNMTRRNRKHCYYRYNKEAPLKLQFSTQW